MTSEHAAAAGPYSVACVQYWDAGWRGILPLPPRRKASPPIGWTGRAGGWPSRADIQAWADGVEGGGNIGLRLPEDVVGLDVDNYGGKVGGVTLERAVNEWGALPATWRSTSRDDGVSGIRLYRAPPGLAWPGELGPGTELIQHNHRYAVAWPSVHPEGRTYRWITPSGTTSAAAVPAPGGLPDLPGPWITGLTHGQADSDVDKADLDDTEAVGWLLKYGAGEPCGLMAGEVDRYIATRFADHSSRHGAAKDATARLTHLAADGHRGAHTAIEDIRTAFIAATENDPARPRDPGEWKRLLVGAIRMAAVDTQGEAQSSDPCTVTVLDDSILNDAVDDPQVAVKAAHERAVAAETNIQRIRRDARRALDNEDAASAFRVPPSRFTLVEELAVPDPPAVYTVDEVMPAGANVSLTAQFKAGKTTMVDHLTKCLADGEPFLGAYKVIPPDGRIALFNYEVDERQYRRWLRELGIAAEPVVSVLNLRGYRLPLVSSYVEDWIVEWLASRDVRVWVVDPFARAFVGSGESENDNTEVGTFLDTLDVIKERSGVTELVIPFHTGRTFTEGEERARGAARIDDWADVRWILTKDQDDVRYFSATGRDVEVEECALRYDERTRQLSAVGKSRAKESHRKLQEAVISVVGATPGIPLAQLRVAVRQVVGKASNQSIDDAVVIAEMDRLVRVEIAGHGARRHYLTGPTVLDPDDVDGS